MDGGKKEGGKNGAGERERKRASTGRRTVLNDGPTLLDGAETRSTPADAGGETESKNDRRRLVDVQAHAPRSVARPLRVGTARRSPCTRIQGTRTHHAICLYRVVKKIIPRR